MDYAQCSADYPDVANIARGLPVDLIRSVALAKAREAASIEASELRQFVAEACEIAREPNKTMIVEALCKRCSSAEKMITRYIEAIESQYER